MDTWCQGHSFNVYRLVWSYFFDVTFSISPKCHFHLFFCLYLYIHFSFRIVYIKQIYDCVQGFQNKPAAVGVPPAA